VAITPLGCQEAAEQNAFLRVKYTVTGIFITDEKSLFNNVGAIRSSLFVILNLKWCMSNSFGWMLL